MSEIPNISKIVYAVELEQFYAMCCDHFFVSPQRFSAAFWYLISPCTYGIDRSNFVWRPVCYMSGFWGLVMIYCNGQIDFRLRCLYANGIRECPELSQSGLITFVTDLQLYIFCWFSILSEFFNILMSCTYRETRTCTYYSDVIMSAMATQKPCVSIVCSTVCSGANQRKHQNSASPAFVRGIHR